MKKPDPVRRLLGLSLLLTLASLSCSTISKAGIFTGNSCKAADGTWSTWSDTGMILISFRVNDCQADQFIFALNPQMVSAEDAHPDELFTFYAYTSTRVSGDRFSLSAGTSGSVSLEAVFTASTDANGSIRIAKGTQFQSNQYASYQSFKQDFSDTWQATLTAKAGP
jgi:hypothetical protein